MPSLRDLTPIFRAPSFEDYAEAERVAESLGPCDQAELKHILRYLLDRNNLKDLSVHRRRVMLFRAAVERSPDPKLFVHLLRALPAADTALRGAIAVLLPKMNLIDAHDELCLMLASEDQEVREVTAQVLVQVGGRSAFAKVTSMCRQPAFPGRVEAMEVFVPKARHGAIPLLMNVLAAGDVDERVRAAEFLAHAEWMQKDHAAAVEAINVAMEDPDERVISAGVDALAAVAPEEDFFRAVAPLLERSSIPLGKAVVEALRRYESPRAVDYLQRRFRAGPNAIRYAVVDSLEAIGTDAVLPALVEALTFKQITVRDRASKALTNLGRAGRLDIAKTILWLLRARDVNLRRMAVELARQTATQSQAIWERLLLVLRDEDWWVREHVIDVLVELAGERLTRQLAAMLGDPSDVIRRFAVGALARIKDPKTLGALVRCAMSDTDWWAREQAVEAIAGLEDPRAIPYLVDMLARQPQLRVVCVDALRALRAAEVTPQVIALLKDEDPDTRIAAVRFLGSLEDRGAADALRTLDADPVGRVRLAARDVLAQWRALEEFQGQSDRAVSVLDKMLIGASAAEADDMVIAAGRVAYVKKLGKMRPMGTHVFTAEQVRGILTGHLTPEQREALDRLEEIDFSYEVKSRGTRFRGHIFHQLAGLGAVFREVRGQIPSFEGLGLPATVAQFAKFKNGLVLVGGPTGSGKSTTLASLIDYINRSASNRHIVTLEDPIEVVHARKGCLVNQREIGTHARDYRGAMRSILRQDPDVILVGEMRDHATVNFAVTAAETGHLVLGTVHTVSADTTVDRVVNVFPPAHQSVIRSMLAESLRAVLCQHLIPRADGPGRVLACEVLINNEAVSHLIRKGRSFQIQQVLATSRDQGMLTMDGELARLFREGKISAEDGYMRANDKRSFEAVVGWSTERSEVGKLPEAP
ncbi:MAG: PilT/PilU family type 4a pilus ATPase [Polyangiales bacterium]